MASTELARVTGTVLSVPPARGGIIKNGPRQGEPWSIESVNVLVADMNVTPVQLPRRGSDGVYENLPGVRSVEKGELVDFLCEVSVYGQEVQLRVLGEWPEESTSYLSAAS